MKHVISLFLMLSLVISLSACGKSQADEATASEYTDSMTNLLDELNAQAEELANTSSEITEGDLYNAVIAIHPDVVLTTLGDGTSLSIYIFLDEQSPEDTSKSFYDILNAICNTCALEKTYSDLTFMMFVDGSFVALLTRIDYTSPISFSSTPPIVIEEEYEEYLNALYYSNDSSNDISTTFDATLDELYKKYK